MNEGKNNEERKEGGRKEGIKARRTNRWNKGRKEGWTDERMEEGMREGWKGDRRRTTKHAFPAGCCEVIVSIYMFDNRELR